MKTIRCAIYTRKSSEEGLEQDFNSLDAQREACAAYVLSQASEGWQLQPTCYDDGGLSGGTLERPALQRLLADIAAGTIDIVVVYKVDRLTRSLLDFAKLVEVFDRAGASFVSITQSFNTTTSMGRLTLNMLLSFAQFEREVTAERIRDKIAASKAKGMWMGGTPPLGYRPDGRTLAIVEEHAALVRFIHQRYLELGRVRALAEELARSGVNVPVRQRRSGEPLGGGAFTRGQLYTILRNPIYVGRIVHRDREYAGQHPAIVTPDTWERVQKMLAGHVRGSRTARETGGAVLAGMIEGPAGEPLISAHACKGKVRYRYYVSRDRHHEGAGGIRVPAREIEGLVGSSLSTLLADSLALAGTLRIDMIGGSLPALQERARELAAAVAGSRRDLAPLIARVRVGEREVAIDVDGRGLARALGVGAGGEAPEIISLVEPVRLTRTGRALRLVDPGGRTPVPRAPDRTLIKLVVTARRWWAELSCGEVDIATLAAREAVTPSWMTRVLRLAFLSPEVIAAILNDDLPAGLSGGDLLATGAVPACWRKQRDRFLSAESM
jgi:site-specific DNA recombinase